MAGPGVEFRGYVSDEEKERLLARAWLLVHSAHIEGWGLVVMEAARVGTPTLAFNVPGLRDSVADGESGTLAGTEEDFVERWIALASDPARRADLSAGARRRAAEFPWSRTVDQFLDAAHEALELHPAPVRLEALRRDRASRRSTETPVLTGQPVADFMSQRADEASETDGQLQARAER
jgi:hypothetical protein